MPYSVKEAQQIKLRAQRVLGKMEKQSAGEKRIFMQDCIDQLTESGEADGPDDARDICEMLWEEGEDVGEE